MTDRDLETAQRHPDEQLLLDVALGHADVPARQGVASHLVVCGQCRIEYDELAAAIEQVLPAVPRVSPPPRFEQSVLARLADHRSTPKAADLETAEPGTADPAAPGLETAEPGTAGPETVELPAVGLPAVGAWPPADAPARPARNRRRWLVPVAAALVGISAGSGVTAIVLQDRPAHTVAAATPIVTDDGEQVGVVTRTIDDGQPALVVVVDAGPVGASYTCRLVLGDGSTQDVGDWALSEDGVNSWVVPDPGAHRVELLTESGAVWSYADL